LFGARSPFTSGQALVEAFLAKRKRATRPAAAAPNRIIIGGAGTGEGFPLLLPPWPPLDDQPPFDDQWPPFELQPWDDEP
jgi:hypothetical protein